MVRLVNLSPRSGEVHIEAVDDAGRRFGPVPVQIAAGHTVELGSEDLLQGNPFKGLWSGIGSGTGDWRLVLRSSLHLEVLAYALSPDGLYTPLHHTVEPELNDHWIGLFPGARGDVAGHLRLVNSGDDDADVTIRGVDDAGTSAAATLTLAPQTSRWLTSSTLAAGTGLSDALGAAAGDWRLTVTSSVPIEVMALSSTASGTLSNLSRARRHFLPLSPAPGSSNAISYADAPAAFGPSHIVWWFPTVSSGTQGLLRLVNRSADRGQIILHARDERGWRRKPVTVALGGGQAVTLTGSDLEFGNAAKGLVSGLGAGEGSWRFAIHATPGLELLSYLQAADGALTPLHEVAPRSRASNRYTVPLFGAGDGELWLLNRAASPASVRVAGVDEEGQPSQTVRLTVPGGGSRILPADLLSWGGPGVEGYLGPGAGRWRLSVWTDGALEVMALGGRPGQRMNVSASSSQATLTGTVSPLGDLNGDGNSDILLRHADGRWIYYPMDGREPLTDGAVTVALERDLHWRMVGLGDLDGDGKDDVLLRHTDGRWLGYLMDGRTVRSSGELALPKEAAWRVAGLGDLDGSGTADVVLRHTDGRWLYGPLEGLSLSPSGLAEINATKNLAWQHAGIGDLDGDGRDDLLLRHDDGRWYYYRMVGSRVGGGRGVLGLTRNFAWSLAGLSDLNGDGTDDALLRHVDGRWFYYPLAGKTILPDQGLVNLTRNRSWSVMGVGDLDGDGHGGVLLRHDDGRWYYYAMQGRELVDNGKVSLTRNLAWTPTGAEPELDSGPDDGAEEETSTAEEVFASLVSDAVVQGKCINCHVSGGISSNTRLVFVSAVAPDHEGANQRVFEDFVQDVSGGAELILNKVQGVGHGGGEQLPAGSTEFASLRRFLGLLGQDTGGPSVSPSALFDGVRIESRRETLRRAAIVFAGRVPTEQEYAAIASGGTPSLRAAVRGLMQGPEFHEFLIRAGNDRLLTDREEFLVSEFDRFVDYMQIRYRLALAAAESGSDEDQRRLDDWENAVQYGAFRGPPELIAHVVENDLPYTEILTADYIMANLQAAEAFGDATAFADDASVHEFQPVRIKSYYRNAGGEFRTEDTTIGQRLIDPGPQSTVYPHAGILNSKAFLQRYPTTPTNRNRARSRWTHYHFLGLDIEKSASRTTDPVALADTNNPTMHNPACTVCHTVLDPVAGTFQNYGDEGLYRDGWWGLDAIDDFYKHGAEDEERWLAGQGSFEITARQRADRQTLAVRAWLAAGEEHIQIQPSFDPPREDDEDDLWWHMGIDAVIVRNSDGGVVQRIELQSLDPDEMCGRDEPNVDEDTGEEFYESWFCRQEVFADIPTDGWYEVEVVVWEHVWGDRVADSRRRLVDIAVGGYQEGDTWYRDMRRPGLASDLVADADASLAWLARKIVQDARFAEAAVRFWWPAVMGAEVAEPPAEQEDRGFQSALLAANAQSLEIKRLAGVFRSGFRGGERYNVKDLLTEIVLSDWFRAKSVASSDSVRIEALRPAGARRLLTPEELARKTVALTGFQWGRHGPREWHRPHEENRSLLTGEDDYRLLYGGIDSDGVTDRARDLTSVMAGVAQSHALQSSCPIVMRELYLLPDGERRLFQGVERHITPAFEFATGFDVEADRISSREKLSFKTGRLRAGDHTVRLSFTNNDGDENGDRNLRIDSLLVRDSAGRFVGKWELEDFRAPSGEDCNYPVRGHFALHCNGSIEVPVTVKNAGRHEIEIEAWADQYGDELARLEVVVESNTSTSVGSKAIREQLVSLYQHLLGVELAIDSPEVRNAYGLFVEVWKRKRELVDEDMGWQRDIECHWDSDSHFLDGIVEDAFVYREDWGDEWGARYGWDWDRVYAHFDTIDWSDRQGVARTWAVVLSHLLMDYRYLYL